MFVFVLPVACKNIIKTWAWLYVATGGIGMVLEERYNMVRCYEQLQGTGLRISNKFRTARGCLLNNSNRN